MRFILFAILCTVSTFAQRRGQFGGSSRGQRFSQRFESGRSRACEEEKARLCPAIDAGTDARSLGGECLDVLMGYLEAGEGDLSIACQDKLSEIAAKKEEKMAELQAMLSSDEVVIACGADFCLDLDIRSCFETADSDCQEALRAARGSRGGKGRRGRGGRLSSCQAEKERLCGMETDEDIFVDTKSFLVEGGEMAEARGECKEILKTHFMDGTGDLSEQCMESIQAHLDREAEKKAAMAELLQSESVVDACGEGFCPDLDIRTCLQEAEEECVQVLMGLRPGRRGRGGSRSSGQRSRFGRSRRG